MVLIHLVQTEFESYKKSNEQFVVLICECVSMKNFSTLCSAEAQIFAFAEGIKLKPLFVCLKLQRKHMLFLSTFWLLCTCPSLTKFAENYDIWKRSKIWICGWYQDGLQPNHSPLNPKLVNLILETTYLLFP